MRKMKKIVVVDDDLGILEVLKIVLEQYYKVKTFSNPGNLIKTLQKERPDLVLLDIWISGYDGTDLTRKIKSDNSVKNIPVVLLSAKNENNTKVIAETGAEDFIEKPFDIDDLLNRVNRFVS